MIGISDSREQSGTTVTNTFSPRFRSPNTGVFPAAPRPRPEVGLVELVLADFPPRLADALAEDCSAQNAVVVVGGVAVHPADVRRLRRRQVVLEAQKILFLFCVVSLCFITSYILFRMS